MDVGDTVLAAICGSVSIVYRGLNGTMDLLKAPIVEQLEPADRTRGAFEDLLAELSHPTIGTRALVRSLLLQCMILLFRKRLLAGDESMSWIRGLTYEGLWDVLRMMLGRPEGSHSVESLAALAGMSRAA